MTIYKEGFGDLNGDKLWYGLKALSCFTETGQWELRIDFQFDNKTWSHLHCKQFKVGSSSAEYPLTIGGFTSITLADHLSLQILLHNLSMFFLKDVHSNFFIPLHPPSVVSMSQ